MNTNKNIKIFTILLSLLFLLNSCGAGEKLKNIRKPVDLRTAPLDPDEKARKNIEQGKGISIGGALKGNRNTNYEFSTANPSKILNGINHIQRDNIGVLRTFNNYYSIFNNTFCWFFHFSYLYR